jgi:HSP20 family protein
MSLFPMTRISDPFPELDRVFDLFMNDSVPSKNLKINQAIQAPRANVLREDKGYTIELAVPGFSRGDFDIDVSDNVLTISVVSEDNKEYTSSLKRREFSYSSFSRSWSLPEGTLAAGIEAEYRAGILNVSIPTETARSTNRKIEVN